MHLGQESVTFACLLLRALEHQLKGEASTIDLGQQAASLGSKAVVNDGLYLHLFGRVHSAAIACVSVFLRLDQRFEHHAFSLDPVADMDERVLLLLRHEVQPAL